MTYYNYDEIEPYTGNKYTYPFYKLYEFTGLFILGFISLMILSTLKLALKLTGGDD